MRRSCTIPAHASHTTRLATTSCRDSSARSTTSTRSNPACCTWRSGSRLRTETPTCRTLRTSEGATTIPTGSGPAAPASRYACPDLKSPRCSLLTAPQYLVLDPTGNTDAIKQAIRTRGLRRPRPVSVPAGVAPEVFNMLPTELQQEVMKYLRPKEAQALITASWTMVRQRGVFYSLIQLCRELLLLPYPRGMTPAGSRSSGHSLKKQSLTRHVIVPQHGEPHVLAAVRPPGAALALRARRPRGSGPGGRPRLQEHMFLDGRGEHS
jgi:hypothetical protein